MEKFNRHKILLIHLSILAIVSLIPFLWVSDGSMILGHDAGTPINPTAHFLDRLQTWTHRYALGSNQTFALPGMFIHGLEYVLDQIGLSVSMGQGVAFFLYMFGMGSAMYYLAKTLFPDKKYVPLFAALFYQVNHFVLQAWFIAERTKFTTYIVLPLVLAFIYALAQKKTSAVKASIIVAILVAILNGGGFLPLFGSILVLGPLWVIVLIGIHPNKLSLIKRYGIFFVLAGIFSLFLNSFWLIPYISYLKSSFHDVSSAAGGMSGVIGWLKSISLNSSYINLFRLQGLPEWYSNPNHPYAHVYLQSAPLILVSYIFPVLAFAPLVFAKKHRKTLALIALSALVSIFFMAGSHAPLGWLYILLIKYVPGFIAFRTAYYKFAPGLWLSYSLLIAFTLDYCMSRIPQPLVKKTAVLLCGVAIVAYSYPFITQSFFKYDVNRTTRVKVPEYISRYGDDQAAQKIPFNRLMIVPPQQRINPVEHTAWDYWSLASVNSLLDQKSYVNRSSDLSKGEKTIVDELYDNLDTNNPEWLGLAKRLQVDGVLLREDSTPYKQDGHLIDAKFYKEKLAKAGLKEVMTYGKWHIYSMDSKGQDVTLHSSYAVVKDLRQDMLYPDLGFQFSKIVAPETLITFEPFVEDTRSSLRRADITLPSCAKCSFPARKLFNESADVVVFPGSQFYTLKLMIERRSEPKHASLEENIAYKNRLGLRRVFEMRRSIEHGASKDVRINGWNNYKGHIDGLSKLVNEYLTTTKPSTESNEFLLHMYDNVLQQLDEINSMSDEITDTLEGMPFIELHRSVEALYNSLDKASYKTESIHEKKYLFPIENEGTYEIWVDSTSVLTPSHASGEADLAINFNDRTYTRPIAAENGWEKILDVNLKKGTQKLEITDTAPNLIDYDKLVDHPFISPSGDSALLLEVDKSEPCTITEFGVLPRDKHRLAFDVRSEKFSTEISIFVDSDRVNDALLPNLTDSFFAIELGSSHYVHEFVSNGVSPTFMKVCQLFTQQKDTLVISNLSLQRITSPQIALVKKNPLFVEKSLPNATVDKVNNTQYMVNVAPHDDVLVALNQRFDTGWKLNDSHKQANFYAQAWFVPASTKKDRVLIAFTPQDELKKGLFISIVSFSMLTLGYLMYYLWEKRSRRSS